MSAMIFINNKYTTWYNNIISSAKLRTNYGYTERHHIIPKSLGGDNSKDNLIDLTAREHFVCHWLLTKMVRGVEQQKMAYACKRMMHSFNKDQQRYTVSSHVYENLKQQLNILLKNREFTNAWREKLSISAKIRCNNESAEIKSRKSIQLAKLGRSKKGIKKPYMQGANNPMNMAGTKDKISATFIEKYGVSNPSLVPYVCEHCSKSGKGLAGYKRWHGANCRLINT
jgi:hypothetical protein